MKQQLIKPCDWTCVFRKKSSKFDFEKIKKEVDKELKKIGCYIKKEDEFDDLTSHQKF